jgi:cation-dependent mannose-6-phosphate receptor
MHSLLLLLLAAIPTISAASDPTPTPNKPCTIHSPSTGSFIDLRPLQLTLEGTKTQSATNTSYHAKGYDYPSNFTLNLCGPVVERLEDVEGVPKSKRANVSAYYEDKKGDIYSIGQENHELLFRGKKLLMNYTLGSPCPDLDEDGNPIAGRDLQSRKEIDDDDDNDKEDHKKKPKKGIRHKNTMLSFICDTSPVLSTRPAVSFVGTPDHCTYIFEIRSRYACAGTTPSDAKGTLGPGGVFSVIFGIALLVYVIGGVVYRRNVMHQRGWRQIPNYEVWAGLFGFISVCLPSLWFEIHIHLTSLAICADFGFKDMFVIIFSSCTQSMPSVNRMFGGRRGGYHRVGTDDVRNGRGRGRDPEAENRLIDSYDEEWEN